MTLKTFLKNNKYCSYWALIVFLFLIIVLLIPFLLTRTWGPECMKFTESTGWIGDTLGGITAPFIGFVNIVLLIWTLHKQIEFNKKQLTVQKNEQFKTVFFQLLHTQRELLHEINGTFFSRNMKGYVNNGKVTGLDYFHDACMELKDLFDVLEGKMDDSNGMFIINIKAKYDIKDEEVKEYTERKTYEQQMGFAYQKFIAVHLEMRNYFRHLYHILKFISEEKEDALKNLSDVKEMNGIAKWYKGYADMLQATLSADELKMAYYNCSAFDKAKELFKEFQFVENLTMDKLIRPEKDIMSGVTIKMI